MQHILVLFGRGLRGISRLHFIFGIFGFLTGPLWLLFLLAFNAQVFFQRQTGLSDITVQPWTPFLSLSATAHALLIFGLSTLVLLVPKILALIDLALDRRRAMLFGGVARASISAFLELLYSTLQAPLLMFWHTQFVVSTLLGRSVSWGTQNRQADGASWADSLREHWKHSFLGIVWGAMLWRIDPKLLAWFSPVLIGLLFAVPMTVFTSRRSAGERSRRMRLFLTPEETKPSREILELRSVLAEAEKSKSAVEPSTAISDPYLNALHISLLQRDERNESFRESFQKLAKDQSSIPTLREKVARDGWGVLNPKETLVLLSDSSTVRSMHHDFWSQPNFEN
jgi:membrane glycosyltransferase